MNTDQVTGIDHIGIAVRDLATAKQSYRLLLGREPGGEEIVESEKVRVCFFNLGTLRIELLEGIEPASPISRYVERHGPGIHHVALAVSNLDETVKSLVDSGFTMIEPLIRTGAHGTRIAFAHPKSTGGLLVELCEKH